MYCSVGPGRKRAVITLINKKLQFKCIEVSKDTEGRMIIILAKLTVSAYCIS